MLGGQSLATSPQVVDPDVGGARIVVDGDAYPLAVGRETWMSERSSLAGQGLTAPIPIDEHETMPHATIDEDHRPVVG